MKVLNDGRIILLKIHSCNNRNIYLMTISYKCYLMNNAAHDIGGGGFGFDDNQNKSQLLIIFKIFPSLCAKLSRCENLS